MVTKNTFLQLKRYEFKRKIIYQHIFQASKYSSVTVVPVVIEKYPDDARIRRIVAREMTPVDGIRYECHFLNLCIPFQALS